MSFFNGVSTAHTRCVSVNRCQTEEISYEMLFLVSLFVSRHCTRRLFPEFRRSGRRQSRRTSVRL